MYPLGPHPVGRRIGRAPCSDARRSTTSTRRRAQPSIADTLRVEKKEGRRPPHARIFGPFLGELRQDQTFSPPLSVPFGPLSLPLQVLTSSRPRLNRLRASLRCVTAASVESVTSTGLPVCGCVA